MSIADRLTWLRVYMVPVMVVLLYIPLPYMHLAAAVVYVLAAITDILDGYFARKQNTVSDFGKIMDPIADKLITLAALLVLIEQGHAPAWVGIIIIGREILIGGIRMVVLNRQGKVIAASWLGKCKTVFQDIAVTLFILQANLLFLKDWYISWIFMGVALVFTLWSTVDYCIGAHNGSKEAK